ncbi:MAG: DUF3343 domain-containing protein [Clostridia bacterium]|nr:DUF3343 domain-containing protein [Clostridia bacterium]
MKYIIIAFSSRSYAVEARGRLNTRGIHSTIVNTPREADGSCGLSLRLTYADMSSALSALTSMGMRAAIKAVVSIEWSEGRKIVTKIL